MAGQEREINTTRSGDFETAGTEFRDTMDPQSRRMYVDGKFVGNIMWHSGSFVVNISTPFTLPIGLLADILRQRNEISAENEVKKREAHLQIAEHLEE